MGLNLKLHKKDSRSACDLRATRDSSPYNTGRATSIMVKYKLLINDKVLKEMLERAENRNNQFILYLYDEEHTKKNFGNRRTNRPEIELKTINYRKQTKNLNKKVQKA